MPIPALSIKTSPIAAPVYTANAARPRKGRRDGGSAWESNPPVPLFTKPNRL